MPSFMGFLLVLPILGALGIVGLSFVPRLRSYSRYVALGVVALLAVLTLLLRLGDPAEANPLSWTPSFLLGVTPLLASDHAVQPFAMAAVLGALSAILVDVGRGEENRPRFLAVVLGLIPLIFVSVWAATPLAMIIGWAGYDLLQMVGRLVTGGTARTAMRELVFGSLATLMLWGGALAADVEGNSALWSLMTPPGVPFVFWMIAAALRLWIYPLHLAAPQEPGSEALNLAFLQGPIIGWGLCYRLTQADGGTLPGGMWVPILAAITILLGGFLAWSCRSRRAAIPWVGMGGSGLVLLAAGLAGREAGAVIVTGGVAWILSVATLFLSDGLRKQALWWSIAPAVGSLAILGLPFTLGFGSTATMLGGLAIGYPLVWSTAFFFGMLFLVPALYRGITEPASSPPPDDAGRKGAYLIGIGLPAVLLVMAGLYPPLLIAGRAISLGAAFVRTGVAGWFLWVISLAIGGVLAWQDGNVRSRIDILLAAVHDLLRLEWLYELLVGAIDRGLSALRAADEVVEGAGALLWAWVLFLLIMLVWSGG